MRSNLAASTNLLDWLPDQRDTASHYNHLRFVLRQVNTCEQVVEYLLNEHKPPVFKLLCALKHFRHVLDVLGVVAVQLVERLVVALTRRLHFFTTLFHLVLQLLHLQFASVKFKREQT